MNALFLKDEKTHRRLRGRVEGGKSAGGLCYGYRVVKSLTGGIATTGGGDARGDRTNEGVVGIRRPSLRAALVAGARNQHYLQLWRRAA